MIGFAWLGHMLDRTRLDEFSVARFWALALLGIQINEMGYIDIIHSAMLRDAIQILSLLCKAQ